jgi:hypothetical protein
MQRKHSAVLHFRCTHDVKVALENEAQRQLLSPSAYARRALVQNLRDDGAIEGPNRRQVGATRSSQDGVNLNSHEAA